MDEAGFSQLSDQEQEWIDAYVDGSIGAADFEHLQDRMMESPELRSVMRRYLSIDHSLREQSAEAGMAMHEGPAAWAAVGEPGGDLERSDRRPRGRVYPQLAVAAVFAFLLGTAFMYLISGRDRVIDEPGSSGAAAEKSAEGFAVVGQLLEAGWPDAAAVRREGDLLGAEVFRLASGAAEIQFFSGASMIVEGPAEIALKSAWEASCLEGAVRMHVPPPARGFKLQAPTSEIVDLGTEFGLVVRDGSGHVEVFDGEISISHLGAASQSVKQGGAFSLSADRGMEAIRSGTVEFPETDRLGARSDDRLRADFARWEAHRDALARDKRLIAYYTFDRPDPDAQVPNLAVPRDPELDGAVILAEPVAGRWKGMKSALEFRRPGSRVRVNIPGEFPAFTFAAWVRVDSLDRRYNALFMGDGYEDGEPHWQIRDDGKMMLSVMVDDSRPHPKYSPSRFHHVYFSPPMWDLSMSGEWMHLASVYDPAGRQVSHYVDGALISREVIEPDFFVGSLRIGNGEIGNWGQPFREDPSFAIRNLNGRLDEVAIFRAALGDAEIKDLFQRSRSSRR